MEKYLELKNTFLNKIEIKGPNSYEISLTIHIGMKADENTGKYISNEIFVKDLSFISKTTNTEVYFKPTTIEANDYLGFVEVNPFIKVQPEPYIRINKTLTTFKDTDFQVKIMFDLPNFEKNKLRLEPRLNIKVNNELINEKLSTIEIPLTKELQYEKYLILNPKTLYARQEDTIVLPMAIELRRDTLVDEVELLSISGFTIHKVISVSGPGEVSIPNNAITFKTKNNKGIILTKEIPSLRLEVLLEPIRSGNEIKLNLAASIKIKDKIYIENFKPLKIIFEKQTDSEKKEKSAITRVSTLSRQKELLYDLSKFIKDFVGRKEILGKIERIDRGVIFLKGDVGVGKTAIAAKIASEKKVPCLLIGKKPREIASLPSGNQVISELVKQINHYYGLNISVDITDRESTLRNIRDGLEKIYESLNEVPFIIIDGVDEAEDPEEIVRIVEQIATKNSKILVTYKTDTIKDEVIERVAGTLEYDDIQTYYGDEFYLQADVNDKDIREYVEKKLNDLVGQGKIPAEKITEHFMNKIIEKISGRFIIAVSLIGLIEKKAIAVENVDELPVITDDLSKYYAKVLEIVRDKLANEILELLAIVRSGVTKSFVAAFFHYTKFSGKKFNVVEDRVYKSIDRISPFLIFSDSGEMMLFHDSLKQYLLKKLHKGRDAENHEVRLHRWISIFLDDNNINNIYPDFVSRSISEYAYWNLIYHMFRAMNYEQLINRVNEIYFIRRVSKEQNQMLDDLSMAIKASYELLRKNSKDNINEKDLTIFLKRIFKFARRKSELTIINIPIELIGVMVELGKINDALYYFDVVNEFDRKLEILNIITKKISETDAIKYYNILVDKINMLEKLYEYKNVETILSLFIKVAPAEKNVKSLTCLIKLST